MLTQGVRVTSEEREHWEHRISHLEALVRDLRRDFENKCQQDMVGVQDITPADMKRLGIGEKND